MNYDLRFAVQEFSPAWVDLMRELQGVRPFSMLLPMSTVARMKAQFRRLRDYHGLTQAKVVDEIFCKWLAEVEKDCLEAEKQKIEAREIMG